MKFHALELEIFIFGRYGSLLIALLLLMILQPIVDTSVGKYLLEALFIVALIAGLRAIKVKKELLRFEVILLVISLVLNVAGTIPGYEDLFFTGIAGRALFMILVAVTILFDLFRSPKVTGDSLAGAVCIYLMIALIWGHLFLLVEFLVPGSFSFTHGDKAIALWLAREFYPFYYFSLITMTTVGFGDMLPLTTAARTLTTLEAIIGQVYLTILVARLVGMYLVGQQKSEE
jgi:hypothetical protein